MKGASSTLPSLAVDRILYIQAKGNYLHIHFDGKRSKQLIRATLKKVECHYNESTLVRVHNSYLANLAKAIKCQSGKLHFLSNDTRLHIPVSRKYIKEVRTRLESLLSIQGEIVYTANDPGYPF